MEREEREKNLDLIVEPSQVLYPEAMEIRGKILAEFDTFEEEVARLKHFETAVTEVHRRCDVAGIEKASGRACEDPECQTQSGHRVKVLIQERDGWEGKVERREDELEKANASNQRLRDWKEAQLKVEATWDPQAVGKALGLSVAEDIRAGILPGIKALRAKAKELGDLFISDNARWDEFHSKVMFGECLCEFPLIRKERCPVHGNLLEMAFKEGAHSGIEYSGWDEGPYPDDVQDLWNESKTKKGRKPDHVVRNPPLMGPVESTVGTFPNMPWCDLCKGYHPKENCLTETVQRLSRPDAEEKPWWCQKCQEWLSGEIVTFEETHDERSGGCGENVYVGKPYVLKADRDKPPEEQTIFYLRDLPPGELKARVIAASEYNRALETLYQELDTLADLDSWEKCKRCGGFGAEPEHPDCGDGSGENACPDCSGHGIVPGDYRALGKGAKFIEHIKAHLKEGEPVLCKICGKTVEEIERDILDGEGNDGREPIGLLANPPDVEPMEAMPFDGTQHIEFPDEPEISYVPIKFESGTWPVCCNKEMRRNEVEQGIFYGCVVCPRFIDSEGNNVDAKGIPRLDERHGLTCPNCKRGFIRWSELPIGDTQVRCAYCNHVHDVRKEIADTGQDDADWCEEEDDHHEVNKSEEEEEHEEDWTGSNEMGASG